MMAPRVAETPDNAVRLIILGTIDAALGRKADAIAEGEQSVRILRESGDRFLWDPLRGDPRFEAIVPSLAPRTDR